LFMPGACNVGLWPAAERCARGMTAGALTMARSLVRFVVVTARRFARTCVGPVPPKSHRSRHAFQTAIGYAYVLVSTH
jgi:hypothetical protein